MSPKGNAQETPSRPVCLNCGVRVTGRSDRVYCSDRCKGEGWRKRNVARLLEALDESAFRTLLGGVMARRTGQASGRLRVRWR